MDTLAHSHAQLLEAARPTLSSAHAHGQLSPSAAAAINKGLHLHALLNATGRQQPRSKRVASSMAGGALTREQAAAALGGLGGPGGEAGGFITPPTSKPSAADTPLPSMSSSPLFNGPSALLAGASRDAPSPAIAYAASRDAYAPVAPPALGAWACVQTGKTARAYMKGRTILLALRGTASGEDADANGAVVANALQSSARYASDAASLNALFSAYPPASHAYYLTGHSLGGAIAQQLAREHVDVFGRNPGVVAFLFNSANQPQDLASPVSGAVWWYASNDPLLALAHPWWNVFGDRPPPAIYDSPATALAAHRITVFAPLFPDAPPPGGGGGGSGVRMVPAYSGPPGGVDAAGAGLAPNRQFITPLQSSPPGTPPPRSVDDGADPAWMAPYTNADASQRYSAALSSATGGTGVASIASWLSSRLGLPTLVSGAFHGRELWNARKRESTRLLGGSAASRAAAARTTVSHQAEIALSDGDIKTLIGGGIRVLTYPEIEHYKSINALLAGQDAVVLLYLTESKTCGHWTAILRHVDSTGRVVLEYFDSYGGAPDAPFSWLTHSRREALDQTRAVLAKLLKDSPYPVDYNHARLQEKDDDVNTCGRHVVVRLWHRGERLQPYLRWLLNAAKEGGTTPDGVVTRATSRSLAFLHATHRDAS